MEYRLEHIRAGIPTSNGRTYSKAILQMMVDDAQARVVGGELLIHEAPHSWPNVFEPTPDQNLPSPQISAW